MGSGVMVVNESEHRSKTLERDLGHCLELGQSEPLPTTNFPWTVIAAAGKGQLFDLGDLKELNVSTCLSCTHIGFVAEINKSAHSLGNLPFCIGLVFVRTLRGLEAYPATIVAPTFHLVLPRSVCSSRTNWNRDRILLLCTTIMNDPVELLKPI